MPVQIIQRRFGVLSTAITWFNDRTDIEPLRGTYMHTFYQSKAAQRFLGADCISDKVFRTTVLDLCLQDDELLGRMDPKSCRYEIRKVQKLIDQGGNVVVESGADYDDFLQIANGYIQVKRYMRPLTMKDLNPYLDMEAGELFTLHYDGRLIGGNFYLKSYPERVRLLLSYNNRFESKELANITGALMRYFHWNMIRHYREKGYKSYDFGGVDLDASSPTYGIAKFKLSFGGEIREERNYVLVPKNVLGRLYRAWKARSAKSQPRSPDSRAQSDTSS
jgi:hypothetical protein